MSPVSSVFQTEVTMSIDLKTNLRVGTSIPQFDLHDTLSNSATRNRLRHASGPVP